MEEATYLVNLPLVPRPRQYFLAFYIGISKASPLGNMLSPLVTPCLFLVCAV